VEQNCTNFNASSFLLLTSLSIIASRFERKNEIPKVADIWIPKAYISFNCFISFFALGIENLLQISKKILRVEVGGNMSQLMSWGFCWKLDQEFKW
jgi:hypothetical protein